MKLLYTGADKFLAAQPNSLESLGGFISSSQVENGAIDTIFSPISQNAMQAGSSEIRVLAILNDSGADKTISIHYNNLSAEPVSYLKMALVSPASDNCGNKSLEKLASPSSIPVAGNFVDNRSDLNKLTFDLTNGSYMGLFIQRIVSKKLGSSQLTCDALYSKFISTNSKQVSAITFNTVPEPGDSFYFYTKAGRYLIGYTDGTTYAVPQDSYERINVLIGISETVDTIAQKTLVQLSDILEERGELDSITRVDNVLTITQSEYGLINVPTGTFINSVDTLGSTSEIDSIENIELVIEY